jgi:cellulose synthase operon protein C
VYTHRFGVIIGAALCLTVSIAMACGPDFPWQLLDDRPATFKATPANSFAFEAVRLVTPSRVKLTAIEDDDANALAKAEAVGLSAEQAALVQQMRKESTGDLAFQQSAVLPISVRLYTAGAIDFHQLEMSKATERFEALLQLPESDRLRATWAAYMLGRIYAQAGDSDKASAEFQLTRTLAMKGAPDPLGLAVASYGEEARLHLKRAESYFTTPNNLPRERSDDYVREMAAAVRLYAQEAALGSSSAVNSLRMVAEQLLGHQNLLQTAIGDPIVQRLLAGYALAYAQSDAFAVPLVPPGFDHVKGADLFAAAAYGAGNYPRPRMWADKASSPLASWVKAKLALQRYDLGDAAAFYAEASSAFPAVGQQSDLDDHNIKLLTGETGTLALVRGEYVEALRYLYPVASTYWGDVAYIAERVLTADELKQFVDARVPVPAPTPSPAATDDAGLDTSLYDANPAAALRDLLARRLVREGRYQEALPYFHLPGDSHFQDPDVRQHVTDYARALHKASSSWRRVNRARGWYQAAVSAQASGMAMMGYEGAPDSFISDGEFDGGYGQTNPGNCFVTDGELSRFAATTPKPDVRLHYRFLAVDEAVDAADLLPPRSQAFAAVLCHATGWMMSTENIVDDKEEAHALVRELYHRYLREGPHVPWALDFGRACPDPDFESAARLPRTLAVRHARHFVGRYRWQLGLSSGVLFIALSSGLAWFWRRRQLNPD